MTATPTVSWLTAPAETVTFTLYRRSCGFHVIVTRAAQSAREALHPELLWKVCIPMDGLPPSPANRDVLVAASYAFARPELADWRKCDRL